MGGSRGRVGGRPPAPPGQHTQGWGRAGKQRAEM